MSRKRIWLLGMLLCLTVIMCGCRVRTTGTEGQADPAAGSASGTVDGRIAGENPLEGARAEQSGADQEKTVGEDDGAPGSRTRENPEATRKEFDEDAPAEIVPGTDHLLHSEGEGSGAPRTGEEARESVNRAAEGAEKTATQTVAAEEAETVGVDPDAEAADSALTYFTVLLSDRMGSVFECQRANVYWETAQDHVTVHKTSLEHSLILMSGAYDVSARLLEENLKVDDGWVVRKNPGLIVKVVEDGVLGGGVLSASAAQAEYQRLISRPDWRGIDAVRNGRVVLLSGELLRAPYLQAAAMLIMAGAANPELFADVDPEEALRMLTEEATGTIPTGIYYYQGGVQ